MSFANTFYNLRSANATMVQVADAIDGLARGETSNATVTATGSETASSEGIIFVNNSSNITRTLPAPAAAQGKTFVYIKISDNANTCTIATPSGSIFGGIKNELAERGDYLALVSNGSNFFQISGSVSGLTTWTPTVTGGSGMPVSTSSVVCVYELIRKRCFINVRITGSVSPTLSDRILVTLPFTASSTYLGAPFAGQLIQPGQYQEVPIAYNLSTTQLGIFRNTSGNYLSGTYEFVVNGAYLIA